MLVCIDACMHVCLSTSVQKIYVHVYAYFVCEFCNIFMCVHLMNISGASFLKAFISFLQMCSSLCIQMCLCMYS